MGNKQDICDLCGEQKFIEHKLKDGTKMCAHCGKKLSGGCIVDWNKITREDFHYFSEIPMADDNFNPDFEFKGFKADTKAGVFSVSSHKELFEFKSIKKYYITYVYTERNGVSNDHYMKIKSARLVIEIEHPVISGVQQVISRDKESLLEAFDVLDVAAKKSYENHNKKLLELLKKQTGKSISMSKRENQ